MTRVISRLNAICPYFTMFPTAFPLGHLRGLEKGSWVLDPFCGRGTTAFAARARHLPSCSVDVSPIAVAIAKSKLATTSPYAIVERAREILKYGSADRAPNGEFWRLAFHPIAFDALLKLRRALRKGTSPADDALRGIVLGALHGPTNATIPSYFSNQMPRTFAPKPDYSVRYWRRNRLKAPNADLLKIVQTRAERYFRLTPPQVAGFVLNSDARTFPDLGLRFQAIITSPPYFGMNTYVPDQWLRSWFLGGPPRVVYRQYDQLARGSAEEFTKQLGQVWKRVAELSLPGAKLVIRFGALSSVKSQPREIIRESLAAADAKWKIHSMNSAGKAEGRYRQANHMGKRAGKADAAQEIDVVCQLG
jgi:DNA modification methylase